MTGSLFSLRSVLSQSVVRSRFLSHCGRLALTPQERQILKKVVEEELLRMQVTRHPSITLISGKAG